MSLSPTFRNPSVAASAFRRGLPPSYRETAARLIDEFVAIEKVFDWCAHAGEPAGQASRFRA